jgi:hypothetical protein
MESINITLDCDVKSEVKLDTISKWENYQKLIKEELILNEISKKYF